jgi:hypothetical protein
MEPLRANDLIFCLQFGGAEYRAELSCGEFDLLAGTFISFF